MYIHLCNRSLDIRFDTFVVRDFSVSQSSSQSNYPALCVRELKPHVIKDIYPESSESLMVALLCTLFFLRGEAGGEVGLSFLLVGWGDVFLCFLYLEEMGSSWTSNFTLGLRKGIRKLSSVWRKADALQAFLLCYSGQGKQISKH